MTSQDVDAILSGHHGDAFSILGPHKTDDGWEVRVFLPQAMDAEVVEGEASQPMRKLRAEGRALPASLATFIAHEVARCLAYARQLWSLEPETASSRR